MANPDPVVPDEEAWTFAVREGELWDGEVIGVRLGSADVLLVNLGGGEFRAYDNRCPHAGARLSEGRLTLPTLQCASHLWEFDVRTGDGVNPRRCSLRRYPVTVVDGAVLVQLIAR